MLENVGDGSEFAAPIFRRLVEIYFNGTASTLLPWETELEAPTVEPTPTPSSSVECAARGVSRQASGINCEASSTLAPQAAISDQQSAIVSPQSQITNRRSQIAHD